MEALARLGRGRWRAASWIAAYGVLVTAPLLVLLWGEMPAPVGFLWDFSMGLGFAALAVIGVQFALTARIRRLTSPFGVDVIYVVHRYLAWLGLGFAATHFGILWWFHADALGVLDPREARWELTAGRAALLLFGAAVVTSEWRKLLRLEYGLWRYTHVVLATGGFGVAIAHVLGVGHYTAAPAKAALWLILTAGWLVLILWMRLGKPWQRARTAYRVAEVRREGEGVWTLALDPEGHGGLRTFKPGQFAWLTLGRSPFSLREHPFSITTAPEDGPRLAFGIKELGDFTGGIGSVRPGERAYLDGPYGVFSIDDHPEATAYVFIAGGIGITPVMSMLRSLAHRGDRRPLLLFNANQTADDVVYGGELRDLARRLRLEVIDVLAEPPEGWTGERGYLTKDMLAARLPEDRAGVRCFLCGPPGLTSKAREALEELGVEPDHIRTEVFELV